MSISFLSLGSVGIRDLIRSYVVEHSSEMVIVGIVIAISAGIAFLATGDLTQVVEAGRKGRGR